MVCTSKSNHLRLEVWLCERCCCLLFWSDRLTITPCLWRDIRVGLSPPERKRTSKKRDSTGYHVSTADRNCPPLLTSNGSIFFWIALLHYYISQIKRQQQHQQNKNFDDDENSKTTTQPLSMGYFTATMTFWRWWGAHHRKTDHGWTAWSPLSLSKKREEPRKPGNQSSRLFAFFWTHQFSIFNIPVPGMVTVKASDSIRPSWLWKRRYY